MKNPTKLLMHLFRWVYNLDWRLLVFLLLPLSLLLFVSFSSASSATTVGVVLGSFSSLTPFRSIFLGNNAAHASNRQGPFVPHFLTNESKNNRPEQGRKAELERSRIAVCLVGGPRRFELTGPSIIQNILQVYRNSDLFLHSPLDSNAYKLSLLKGAPRIAAVKIFQPKPIPVTASELRVLTASNSPNGIQGDNFDSPGILLSDRGPYAPRAKQQKPTLDCFGLLQYFNLVEGCLSMIHDHKKDNNFTYDWIIRTRVDGYWSGPLGPESFVPGHYVVPSGSSFGGLNDRLGIGDLRSSLAALSRLSLLPVLESAGFQQVNSESAFKAQLSTQKVQYVETRFPFCIMSDRKYGFPPGYFGVPVASMSSPGPLSGTKCRPCEPICTGGCVGRIMDGLREAWSWTAWSNDTLHLCDAHDAWAEGWEQLFDRAAGEKLANERKRIQELKVEECIVDFVKMRNRTASWEAASAPEICGLGLGSA